MGRSWFGSSTLLFLLPAWIAGTICLVAPVESVLGNRRSAPIRLVQSAALTGSNWAPMVRDATHAMNLGLAAGALAAIPATIAAGTVLTPRFGGVIRWSALLCCASLIVVAAAQFLGAGHPMQWRLILAAATLMGFAVALPFGRLIPGGRALRMGVTGMLGFAGSIVGLSLVTMAAFVAPLAATALFVWSLRLRNGGAAATNIAT